MFLSLPPCDITIQQVNTVYQTSTAESNGTAKLHSIVHDRTAAAIAAAVPAAAVPASKATTAATLPAIRTEELEALRAQLACEPQLSPFAKYASPKHHQQQQASLCSSADSKRSTTTTTAAVSAAATADVITGAMGDAKLEIASQVT
jgi:hypothetical protein